MISVIVATRDRASLLEGTLDALCSQVSPGCPFEILVADNGSVDGTRDVVEAVARRSDIPVVYLTESRPGKSHALNTAVSRARGELLAFTQAPGVVLRCPACEQVMLRIVETADAIYLDARGAVYLRLERRTS